MSNLEHLLRTLCPNGVEYKKLGDIATIERGGSFQKKDFTQAGFPCIHYGQIYTKYNLFVEKTISYISEDIAQKQKKAHYGDVIMAVTSENIEDVCKCVAWLGQGEVAVSGHTAIIHHSLIPKYLTYFLNSTLFYNQKLKMVQGTKVMEVSPAKLEKVLLPVPPLPVQQEIVRILDSFTQLTDELTAELTARQKQYAYYLNELLKFDNTSIWVEMGTVIKSLNTGLNPRRFFKLNTDNAKNYYVTIRELQNNTVIFSEKTDRIDDEALLLCNNRSNLEIGDVLFSGTGTIGETAIIKEPPTNWNIKEGVYVIKPMQDKLNPKFLMYLLHTDIIRTAIMKKVAGGTVKSIPMNELKKIKIPLPKLSKQAEIVEILDRFDTLCNDLTSGLPAEIEARRKQYEYYRDKLLTFPKCNA